MILAKVKMNDKTYWLGLEENHFVWARTDGDKPSSDSWRKLHCNTLMPYEEWRAVIFQDATDTFYDDYIWMDGIVAKYEKKQINAETVADLLVERVKAKTQLMEIETFQTDE